MSHFYAQIQGNRGEATRGGSKDSGIFGHIRGWNVGVRVDVDHDANLGQDVAVVRKTGGSNDSSGEVICYVYEDGKVKYADERLNLMNSTNKICDAEEAENRREWAERYA
jgi:hypothetical protein